MGSTDQVKVVFSYYSDDSESLFNQIEWVEADLNDIPKLTLAFENISHVYHCATLISFDPSDYKLLVKQTSRDGKYCQFVQCFFSKKTVLCEQYSDFGVQS